MPPPKKKKSWGGLGELGKSVEKLATPPKATKTKARYYGGKQYVPRSPAEEAKFQSEWEKRKGKPPTRDLGLQVPWGRDENKENYEAAKRNYREGTGAMAEGRFKKNLREQSYRTANRRGKDPHSVNARPHAPTPVRLEDFVPKKKKKK